MNISAYHTAGDPYARRLHCLDCLDPIAVVALGGRESDAGQHDVPGDEGIMIKEIFFS